MYVGRGAWGGAWRPRGRGPRGVARAPGFVRCEAGRPGAAKARVRASACCASVYPLLVRAGTAAPGLEGRLLFWKLRPRRATSPARHFSLSLFALRKFMVLAQILGFADYGLEHRRVLACLPPCLSESEVHSCCELHSTEVVHPVKQNK